MPGPDETEKIALRPLLEHMYVEDKRQPMRIIAVRKNVTLQYRKNQRTRKVGKRVKTSQTKPPETRRALGRFKVPVGNSTAGRRVAIEYEEKNADDPNATTKWYKGTILFYSRSKRYLVTFDGLPAEENDCIKNVRKESWKVK